MGVEDEGEWSWGQEIEEYGRKGTEGRLIKE